MTTTKILHNVCIPYTFSGHNGHKPKRSKSKWPQTEKATNRNGHKPKRRQTEKATNRNGQKPKRPQTETATDRNGHKPKRPQTISYKLYRNLKSCWLFLANFDFVFANCIHVFSSYVCHYGDSKERISYSHLLLYRKGYAHGLVCFVVFILRFHIALMQLTHIFQYWGPRNVKIVSLSNCQLSMSGRYG